MFFFCLFSVHKMSEIYLHWKRNIYCFYHITNIHAVYSLSKSQSFILRKIFLRNFWGIPLWQSRFKIQHCHCSSPGSCCGKALIPGSRTSLCYGHAPPPFLLNKLAHCLQNIKLLCKFPRTVFFKLQISLVFVCFSLGPHPEHMEVPRLGVEFGAPLQLPAYTTAPAPWDLSHVCDLHHSPQQQPDP